MRVRGIAAVAAVCVAVLPAAASAQADIAVSSGGEPARHVCLDGAPCTLQYAPLILAFGDRIEVVAPFGAGAVAISSPGGQGASCRHLRRERPGIPERPRKWFCPLPPGAENALELSVTLTYTPTNQMTWDFDARVVGPGQRATDRDARVRFRLAGRYLRLQVIPWIEERVPDARGELFGRRLTAVCARRGGGRRIARFSWPARQEGVSVSFRRPLGVMPRWCLVEDSTGGDIALARFPRR